MYSSLNTCLVANYCYNRLIYFVDKTSIRRITRRDSTDTYNQMFTPMDLTFFKQKLALLTAHHDPYHCSMCGISALDKMKFCSKFDLAQYCSRKCQTEDWKKSHKVSCHETVSLRHSIFHLSERYDEVNQILFRENYKIR